MTFLHKRVGDGNTAFGADLRDLRDLRGISLEQASAETHIQRSLLKAFEEDSLRDINDPIFAERHFLAYVDYLGGYRPYFTARYANQLAALNSRRTIGDLLPRQRSVRPLDFFVGPQFLAFLGVLTLAGVLGAYVLWQARAVNTPPPLVVSAPVDGARLDTARVQVVGRTIPEAIVTVNGQDAPVDGDGVFHAALDIRRGTTVITVIAKRRRGSETRLERHVVFDRPLPDSEELEQLLAPPPEGATTTNKTPF